jgi:hypothetical protein
MKEFFIAAAWVAGVLYTGGAIFSITLFLWRQLLRLVFGKRPSILDEATLAVVSEQCGEYFLREVSAGAEDPLTEEDIQRIRARGEWISRLAIDAYTQVYAKHS